MQNRLFMGRSPGEWLASLPTALILLFVLFLGTGEYIHSQVLKLGESQWDQYFILRADIPDPDCNPDPDIEAETARLVREAEAAQTDELDLFREEVNPETIRSSVIQSREMCAEKWHIAEENRSRVTDSVRAFRFVETGIAKLVHVAGEYKQFVLCLLILICAVVATLTRHHISLRSVATRRDYYFATLFQLVAHACLLFAEISYRAAEQKAMADGVQVQLFFLHGWWIAGFGVLTLISLYQLWKPPHDLEPGGGTGHALLAVPLYAYMSITASLQFWIVPLLGQVAGSAQTVDPYFQGIGIYLSQMMELSGMFLALALYIWIGMLLKQTRITELFFNVIRPWNLSPELMCFVILVIAAFPTAYTGASGIFVIAAGTILYAEFRHNQARRGLALAATAMSGSMGVVLNPCLLVVIVAALDKSVTTAEMFHYGFMIYAMTAILFLVISQITRTQPVRIAPIHAALPASARNFGTLIPYIVIVIATIGTYTLVFDQRFDEFSAPYILPVVLLAVLLYDKRGAWVAHASSAVVLAGVLYEFWMLTTREPGIDDTVQVLLGGAICLWLATASFRHARAWDRELRDRKADTPAPALERRRPIETALRTSVNETTGHIGALLMIMALSVSVGGTIERSHVMEMFPQIDSVWWTMTVLIIVKVIIGMIMDPYGAAILVNATLAPVAFAAGIDPLHFWMFTLLSFELGYLTPPVALNHLLTRHLVGDREVQLAKDDARAEGRNWWYRHERYLLPVTVMFIALMIVSYGPLAWKEFGWAQHMPDWVNALFSFTPGLDR
ncbi:MAG: TRAP transporter large permease subunit [Pseudomonadota bacterium]